MTKTKAVKSAKKTAKPAVKKAVKKTVKKVAKKAVVIEHRSTLSSTANNKIVEKLFVNRGV